MFDYNYILKNFVKKNYLNPHLIADRIRYFFLHEKRVDFFLILNESTQKVDEHFDEHFV